MNEFVEEYSYIKREKSGGLKFIARKMALDLYAFGLNKSMGFDKLLSRPRVQFLYIHHVFRDEEKGFADMLRKLAQHHFFISYSEAWERILNGNIDKPYIAFSSDDGLKNNLRAAAILKEFGASGCFFICPAIIDEPDQRRIDEFCKERLHFPLVQFMNWRDVNQLQQEGHEIGSHTMSHVNLAKVDSSEMIDEIGNTKFILDKQCGETIHFAYPYGRHFHFSAIAKNEVFTAGFLSCASAERGCHITETNQVIPNDNLLIRRDHIVADWPIQHILFFLASNALKAKITNNYFPAYEIGNTYK